MNKILHKMRENEEAILRFGCTEAVERFLGFYYLLWAITVDITASHFYAWMLVPSPWFWRAAGGTVALFRIVALSLGGTQIRFVAAIFGSIISLILSFGFFYAGWIAGGAGHLLFGVFSMWTVFRLQSRLRGYE